MNGNQPRLRSFAMMEENEISEIGVMQHRLTVGIAISGSNSSKYILKWALDKFIPEGNASFKLIHVRSVIKKVPTPMGNSVPISQVREDVANAYKREVEWQTTEMLRPYKDYCSFKKAPVGEKVIESDDVPNAIAEVLAREQIDRLVIGASANGMFSRKMKQSLSTKISEAAPSFCMVYAVADGRLSAVRPPQFEHKEGSSDGSSTNGASISAYSVTQTGMVMYSEICEL